MTSAREGREVLFEAGYDYRAEDANKPFGQKRGAHGLNIRFLLHRPRGTVQFLIFTHWLPGTVGPIGEIPLQRLAPVGPMAADLGYHWDEAHYDDQPQQQCDVRPSGSCFYDGSGLNAQPVFAALLEHGDEAVWALLRDYYDELAGERIP
ncbi:MAG TPA: hypothetical protein VH395_09010 [Jatrophihabitantaceae bacterium]|jgi:hypothetical protein